VTKSLNYKPFEESDQTVGDQNPMMATGNRSELAHQEKVVVLRGVSCPTSVRMTFPSLYLLIGSRAAFRQS